MTSEGRYRYILNVDNNVSLRSILTICRLSVVIYVVCALPSCVCECPTGDRVELRAQGCFRDYNLQKASVDRSDRRLFSGIDIEILRAYCSTYIASYNCVHEYLRECPDSRPRIQAALLAYADAQELTDLCRTHRLYELYAQHMNCFTDRGSKSDWCFDKEINSSVQYLNPVSQEELCSRMIAVTRCIENNIRQGCGEQAAEIVHLLVKPVVRGSGNCNYPIYEPTQHPTRRPVPRVTKQPPDHVTSSSSRQQPNSATSSYYNRLTILLPIILTVLRQIYTLMPS
ncbi:uncharacterized protein LOC128217756 [Mya arenaria]|uniref:uncharacterized protein LOC128217756 n=1 Tax=Mya arenaria TaxID=6604 RepID=UPI0022E6D2E2|nr:uncharacterized protein LOC128217756 [Mya arenaria]